MIGLQILYLPASHNPLRVTEKHRTHQQDRIQDFFQITHTPESRGRLIADIHLPYPGYPIHFYTGVGFEFIVEGNIYNATAAEVKAGLSEGLNHFMPDIGHLRRFISSLSGEFLIVIRRNTTFLILNDPLGRLPVYRMQTNGGSYVGRSLYWLHQHIQLIPDPISVMEYMWSSYPLHFKTLFTGVGRQKGGSIIELDPSTGDMKIHEGEAYNFDERMEGSRLQHVKTLDQLLAQASSRIIHQAADLPVHIALSGGQDSRMAAFYLSKHRSHVETSSFRYPGAESDVGIAERVALHLGLTWNPYTVSRSERFDEELLKMKMGHNYVGLSFLLDYLSQIRTSRPKGLFFITGDGGDKVLPYLGEARAGLSFDQVVQNIANRNSILSHVDVCALFGWSSDDFLQHLSHILASYPESRPNNKSIHFTLFEKVHQSFFEGEDRNRHFFWSSTLFYDLDVFQFAMKIQDRHKRYYGLYRDLIDYHGSTLHAIPDASGSRVHRPGYIFQQGFHEWFRATSPKWKNLFKSLVGRKLHPNPMDDMEKHACLTLLQEHPSIGSLIDLDRFTSLLKRTTHDQFLYLVTLARLSKIL